RGGVGARHAAVELDDVAELAGERAAARKLHADMHVLIELEQIEARLRRLGDVGLKFWRLEQSLVAAALERVDEMIDLTLRFADEAKVRALVDMRTRRNIRPPDGDRLAAATAQLDDVQRAGLLEHH